MTGFLRFTGRLTETMEFTPTMGWETPIILRPKDEEGDGTVVVELRAGGDVLTSVPVVADFERACGFRPHGVRTASIVAHVPLVKGGDELVLRVNGRIVHRRAVAAEPPTVEITGLDRTGDKIALEWRAESTDGQPLQYRVVYVADAEHVTVLAHSTNRRSLVVNLAGLPGANEGRLAVLATDGLRSSSDLSKPFRVDEPEPEVWIQSPSTDDLPSDQPVRLCGRAFDAAGRALPEEALMWKVDGEVVAEGTCLASVTGLEPGRHRIELVHRRDGAEDVVETQTIRIAAPSEGNTRLAAMLAKLDGTGS